MRRAGWIQWAAASAACVGMVTPTSLFAATPNVGRPIATASAEAATPNLAVVDVALGAGGTLRGQVLDAQGLPVAGTNVSLRQNDREITAVATNENGDYAIGDLQGGVYMVTAGQGMAVYRVWAEGTAPPSAQSAALIVSGKILVRGQRGAMYWLTNPWVLACLIGAAIAIPIAVSNNKSSSS